MEAKEVIAKEARNQAEKIHKKYGVAGIVILICVVIILCCLLFLLFRGTIKTAVKTLDKYYEVTKNQSYEDQRKKSYEEAYEKAERSSHIADRGGIEFTSFVSEEKLIVMSVLQRKILVETEEEKSKGTYYWIEMSCSADYIVDLREADFVFDEINNMILARIPLPRIANFSTKVNYSSDDPSKDPILFFKSSEHKIPLINKVISKMSAKEISDLKDRALDRAQKEYYSELSGNSQYYSMAKNKAIQEVENLIKDVNYKNQELKVIVQYFE